MIDEGHILLDPVDVVNAEPDFEGIGEMPKPGLSFKLPINCIVINGDVYMPTKADKLSCIGCDLKDKCKHLLMCPALFHGRDFAHTIYKKLESNELVQVSKNTR